MLNTAHPSPYLEGIKELLYVGQQNRIKNQQSSLSIKDFDPVKLMFLLLK